MTRYVFDRVRRRATKRVVCPVCGKKLTRSKTFEQTVNPWNVNPDGTPRTEQEIWAALGIEAAEWQAQPETHTACGPGVRQYGSVDVGGGK